MESIPHTSCFKKFEIELRNLRPTGLNTVVQNQKWSNGQNSCINKWITKLEKYKKEKKEKKGQGKGVEDRELIKGKNCDETGQMKDQFDRCGGKGTLAQV